MNRTKIYKAALKILRNRKIGGFTKFSICIAMRLAIDDKYWSFVEYPELALFQPEDRARTEYWWPSEDFEIRETALLFMIEMTK